MKKIKSASLILVFLLSAIIILPGCSAPSKKPVPNPSPKSVLPGKVTLKGIKPSDAPGMVKDLIERQKDRESFNVIKDGGYFYAVVTRGKALNRNFTIKFKDVEKLDLGNGNSQIRVQVVFQPGQKNVSKGQEVYPVAVARLNINTLPSAFTYSILREKEIPQDVTGSNATPPAEQNQEAQQKPQVPVQPAATNITVTTPPPNASVTSPLTVSGQANSKTITADLKDDRGKVLASKTIGVTGATNGQNGEFSTVLSYTPLSQQVQGTLEVYSQNSSGAKVGTVTVPLTIR